MLISTICLKPGDDLCKQFGPRSGPTKRKTLSGSKLFDTRIMFLTEFLKRTKFFCKISADDKKIKKNDPAMYTCYSTFWNNVIIYFIVIFFLHFALSMSTPMKLRCNNRISSFCVDIVDINSIWNNVARSRSNNIRERILKFHRIHLKTEIHIFFFHGAGKL